MLESVQLITARVLRDNPSLRSISKREEVIARVKKVLPMAKSETITRSCRYLQNRLGQYLPEEYDFRFERQNDYLETFCHDD